MHAPSSSIDHLEPGNWGREELTEADLDFVRRLSSGSGDLVVFQVQLPGGRVATRHWRMVGRKVHIVDWIDGRVVA